MDLTALPYDVSKPGLLIENYPELKYYEEFDHAGRDLFLKLVVLITDENSPFVRAEKNFVGILSAACNYLKIDDHKLISDIVTGWPNPDAETIFSMQCAYFRHNNNWEYNTWYDLMFQYHENSLVLRTPLNASDKDYEKKAETKQKIRNHQVELQKTLVQYENQIFPRSTNIKKVITKHVAKVTNWPEKMAKEKLIQ